MKTGRLKSLTNNLLQPLAEKEMLVAEAERIGAEVDVTATEQTKEAEWQRDVAIIGAEAQGSTD